MKTPLTLRQLLAVAAVALVTPSAAQAEGETPKTPPAEETVTREEAAGGTHWRLPGENGPIHVWQPARYDHDTAGTALYVHGYFTDVDKAWTEHNLAQQFRDSGRNAIFIVPEAPAGAGQLVHYPNLSTLLRRVHSEVGVARPWGPVVGVFHSGAFRTALAWIDDDVLSQVVLLDALYGGEDQFRDWLDGPGNQGRQLVVVAADTLRWTEPMIRAVGGARTVVGIPMAPEELPSADRRARLVYYLSQFGHMPLVTNGKTIPQLFRFSQLGAASGQGGR